MSDGIKPLGIKHAKITGQVMRDHWGPIIDRLADDDDEEPFDHYTERAAETLAYRLMQYLEFLGVITDEHVNSLRWPPFELIEDAEKALME